jgi:hypothetical protein
MAAAMAASSFVAVCLCHSATDESHCNDLLNRATE